MKWNIGSISSSSSSFLSESSSLPPNHPPIPSSSLSPAQCPVHPSGSSSTSPARCPVQHNLVPPARCPVQHDKSTLNPLNNMPLDLSHQPQPGQEVHLPTDRTASTIPRPPDARVEGHGEGPVWDYPSPQQFYNALVRKGWATPEDSVEVMVEIHNWLNEKAWEEVMRWERRLPGGGNAQLARFEGRPGDLSPKARMHLWLSQIFPSRFSSTPPFDRHDWIVTRSPPTTTIDKDPTTETQITTRYVIDYYSAPPDPDGNPVFSLDVRPALDNWESISQRIKVQVEEWLSSGE
ncbi:cytochrome c heme-lyase [Tremella mesenterica]|uniref:Holocytochrome c-type synthase n=1 Tax=Tremella mesenterica TaxID=5217 RepID=A0A4Q1BL51_TREME|nr:cytochrome c heme-lyase [Tremella mesenterica]